MNRRSSLSGTATGSFLVPDEIARRHPRRLSGQQPPAPLASHPHAGGEIFTGLLFANLANVDGHSGSVCRLHRDARTVTLPSMKSRKRAEIPFPEKKVLP
jgi:hypothetical protein